MLIWETEGAALPDNGSEFSSHADELYSIGTSSSTATGALATGYTSTVEGSSSETRSEKYYAMDTYVLTQSYLTETASTSASASNSFSSSNGGGTSYTTSSAKTTESSESSGRLSASTTYLLFNSGSTYSSYSWTSASTYYSSFHQVINAGTFNTTVDTSYSTTFSGSGSSEFSSSETLAPWDSAASGETTITETFTSSARSYSAINTTASIHSTGSSTYTTTYYGRTIVRTATSYYTTVSTSTLTLNSSSSTDTDASTSTVFSFQNTATRKTYTTAAGINPYYNYVYHYVPDWCKRFWTAGALADFAAFCQIFSVTEGEITYEDIYQTYSSVTNEASWGSTEKYYVGTYLTDADAPVEIIPGQISFKLPRVRDGYQPFTALGHEHPVYSTFSISVAQSITSVTAESTRRAAGTRFTAFGSVTQIETVHSDDTLIMQSEKPQNTTTYINFYCGYANAPGNASGTIGKGAWVMYTQDSATSGTSDHSSGADETFVTGQGTIIHGENLAAYTASDGWGTPQKTSIIERDC